MAAVGWATTPLMLCAITVVLGLSSGSVVPLPASMLADLVGGSSGTAVGVFRFFGDLGFVIGPLVGGAAIEAFGFRWAFAIMAAPLLLVALFALRTPETLRREAAFGGSGRDLGRAHRSGRGAPLYFLAVNLEGKAALVTGAASGLGRATVEELPSRGRRRADRRRERGRRGGRRGAGRARGLSFMSTSRRRRT